MLYKALVRMIARGDVVDLQTKIDVFFAMGRLSEIEYTELSNLILERSE